jgi:hypothetical protein
VHMQFRGGSCCRCFRSFEVPSGMHRALVHRCSIERALGANGDCWTFLECRPVHVAPGAESHMPDWSGWDTFEPPRTSSSEPCWQLFRSS